VVPGQLKSGVKTACKHDPEINPVHAELDALIWPPLKPWSSTLFGHPNRGGSMNWRTKVELFAQIRREYECGIGTIKGVARTLDVHRRMVREALTSALPCERKPPTRTRPSMGPITPFIDDILQADRKAPRKQRHTAHRIYDRIRAEYPDQVIAESTVRRDRAYQEDSARTPGPGDLRPPVLHLGAAGPGRLV
jgi:hypothetical protein